MKATAQAPRKLNEYCGVIAVRRREGAAAELLHRGLFALQHRGQEAAGLATFGPTGDLHHLRGRGLVADCLPVYEVRKLPGDRGVGHVRYSTVPIDRTENIQPFVAATPYGRLAIAHNGNIKNAESLRRELEATGSLFATTMDTELFPHLMARSGATSFEDAVLAAALRVQGAYSLTLLCAGRLFALRDPHGFRPLVIGKRPDGWVVASETCALDALQADLVREVHPGELVEIADDGLRTRQLLPPAEPNPCVFELVYFARPNSRVFGQGVYGTRTRMGEQLALQDLREGGPKPDIVVPVPDSGVPAAVGYARRSGVPLEQAILRSHYVGRTFILPSQDARANGVHLKLSVIQEAVEGKVVALIDDSIVRGNTSRQIVAMVREAGAREVWLRVASPPVAWPCYMGIDTPTREELVINREGDPEGVRRFLNADSLRYLSLAGLREATGNKPFCMACMHGAYPV